MHYAVRAASVRFLQVLLLDVPSLLRVEPPALHRCAVGGELALDIAVQEQRWQLVHVLLRAGAVQVGGT